MRADPGYLANLMALPLVERERLLGGNWKIRAAAGLLFRRGWCQMVDAIPEGTQFVRGWDLAATPKTEGNDPDWTVGTKIGRMPDGRFIVRIRSEFAKRRPRSKGSCSTPRRRTARPARSHCPWTRRRLAKRRRRICSSSWPAYRARSAPASGDKVTRFGAFSAQSEGGNVVVLRGAWNEDWFTALESFPPPKNTGHDDDADSTSEAFNELTGKRPMVISDEVLRRAANPGLGARR